MATTPTKTAQWTLDVKAGLDGLKLQEDVAIPSLQPTECLVKIVAVSLNYRDVAIPTGRYPMSMKDNLIPTSDGAGIVVAVGKEVSLHRIGDKVCTLFTQAHQSGLFKFSMRPTALGAHRDGPLREYAVYNQTGLVSAPASLDLNQAATLPCAAVTAWNALNGLKDRAVKPGDVILVQGTGGVSLFALQFALAAGATVIATTSSERKERMLKSLGAHHVLNYKQDLNWGETAKALAGSEGISHVIEVGGESTVAQSLKAIRAEGVIAMIGFLGGVGKPEDLAKLAGFQEAFQAASIIRPIFIGSKAMFVDMNSFIDAHGIKPVIDEKIFAFREARQAYEYLLDQDFFGKILIQVVKP